MASKIIPAKQLKVGDIRVDRVHGPLAVSAVVDHSEWIEVHHVPKPGFQLQSRMNADESVSIAL